MRTPVLRRFALTLLPTLALTIGALRSDPTHAQGQAPSRERTLFVSAVTDRGEPVDTLAPGDVMVREDGLRREVLRVSRAIEPIDLAVLVDNSQAASSALLDLRSSLRAFVTQMAGQNNVAVISIAARPTILVDYTMNAARLQDAVGRLFAQTDTGTTLLDGLTEISTGIGRREATRAVMVVVVTDGVEFTNRSSRDVVEAMQRAGVQMHAVTIGNFLIRNDTERERADVLDQGPRQTGGQRVTLLTSTGLDQALQKLARELSSQFKVVYGRPESLIPPEKTEVSSARAGLVVRGTPARGQTGA